MTDLPARLRALASQEGCDGEPYDTMIEAAERLEAAAEKMGEPAHWEFQHDETGQVHIVDAQQVEWGFEANNPRLQKIRPIYAAPPPAVPEGFVLVPVEPTPLMWDAGNAAHQSPACIYHAMLAAAKEQGHE